MCIYFVCVYCFIVSCVVVLVPWCGAPMDQLVHASDVFPFCFSFSLNVVWFIHLFAFHSPDGLLESLGIMLIQALRQKNLSSRVIIGYKVKFWSLLVSSKKDCNPQILLISSAIVRRRFISQISQGDIDNLPGRPPWKSVVLISFLCVIRKAIKNGFALILDYNWYPNDIPSIHQIDNQTIRYTRHNAGGIKTISKGNTRRGWYRDDNDRWRWWISGVV